MLLITFWFTPAVLNLRRFLKDLVSARPCRELPLFLPKSEIERFCSYDDRLSQFHAMRDDSDVWNCETPAPQPAKYLQLSDLSLERLEALSWPELDALYRAASPGRPRQATYRGRGLYPRDQPFAKLKSS